MIGKVLSAIIFSIIGAANGKAEADPYGHLFNWGYGRFFGQGWYICSYIAVFVPCFY